MCATWNHFASEALRVIPPSLAVVLEKESSDDALDHFA